MRKNIDYVIFLCSIVILSGFALDFFLNNEIELLRPRINIPVIKRPGDSFNVEIETKFPMDSIGSIEISIQSNYNQYNLVINENTKNGNQINVNVTLPLSVTPEVLYNLQVNLNGLTDIQYHAVKVISEFKKDFTMAILTDIHINKIDDPELNSLKRLHQTVDELNLIRPEFVLMLGDNTEAARPDEHRLLVQELMRLEIPIYIIIGNHEQEYISEYLRWFKYLKYTFEYGNDFYFIAVDTGILFNKLTDQDIQWIRNELDSHKTVENIMLMFHGPPFNLGLNDNFVINRVEFLNLCEEYDVTACWFGHGHRDMVVNVNEEIVDLNQPITQPLYVETDSSGSYRLVSFENNKMINLTAAIDETHRHYEKSLNIYNIDIAFNSTNDGTQKSIHANITNKFDYEHFFNCKLRFRISIDVDVNTIMPISNTTFSVFSRQILKDNPNIADIVLEFDLMAKQSYYFEINGGV